MLIPALQRSALAIDPREYDQPNVSPWTLWLDPSQRVHGIEEDEKYPMLVLGAGGDLQWESERRRRE